MKVNKGDEDGCLIIFLSELSLKKYMSYKWAILAKLIYTSIHTFTLRPTSRKFSAISRPHHRPDVDVDTSNESTRIACKPGL